MGWLETLARGRRSPLKRLVCFSAWEAELFAGVGVGVGLGLDGLVLMGEMYTVGMRNAGWIYFLAMERGPSSLRRVSCVTAVGYME